MGNRVWYFVFVSSPRLHGIPHRIHGPLCRVYFSFRDRVERLKRRGLLALGFYLVALSLCLFTLVDKPSFASLSSQERVFWVSQIVRESYIFSSFLY
jgi:hypothetical protein